jgi:hypothetical protein
MPDLLVSIDYSKLNFTWDGRLSVQHTAFIQMVLTGDIELVRLTSNYFPLVSGTHNLAAVSVIIRRKLPSSPLILGIAEVCHSISCPADLCC